MEVYCMGKRVDEKSLRLVLKSGLLKQENGDNREESLQAANGFKSKRPRREAFLVLSRTRDSERFD
jgi:hypothetical protein